MASRPQQRDNETAKEYADRLELAKFLKTHPVDGIDLGPEAEKDRNAERVANRFNRQMASTFGALAIFLIFIGLTGWRASPGTRLFSIVVGSAIAVIQWRRYMRRRRKE